MRCQKSIVAVGDLLSIEHRADRIRWCGVERLLSTLERLNSDSERCAGANVHRFLVGREVDVDDRLPSALSAHLTRTFTDIAGLSESLAAQEDKKPHPVRSPRFRSSASVPAQSAAFATGVPPDICAFHRYTGNSTLPYRTQVTAVSNGPSTLSVEISHPTCRTAYELFTPNKSGQR